MNFNYFSNTNSNIDIDNFKTMIKSLDEANNINDKEVILGLYWTLWTAMISPIELINSSVAKEYGEHINKTMNTVIRLSKARKDMVSAESFIGNLLYYLNNNELSKVSPISNLIDLFKNDLDTFINVEKNIVNNFRMVDREFDLEEKTSINIEYKKYISDLYLTITSIYGVKETVNLMDELKNTLDLVFPEILSISDGLDRFNGELRSHSKDKLKEIYLTNRFDFYGENSQFAYDLIQLLDDDEIKVFKLYYLYKLAGFDGKHFVIMEVNDESMALELGMDKNLFKKVFRSIARKSKMMHLKQTLRLGKTRKRIK